MIRPRSPFLLNPLADKLFEKRGVAQLTRMFEEWPEHRRFVGPALRAELFRMEKKLGLSTGWEKVVW